MDFMRIDHLPTLRSPTMIAAFAGWNDAAEVATGVVNHLVNAWSAESFATIDPEDFYDFTETRPHVRMVDPHQRQVDWPANTFYAYSDPLGRRDALLLVGVEPQLRWRTFTTGILDLAQQCGASSLVCIGGLLAEVTHTRPPRVSGSGTTPELLEQVRAIGIEGSRYEGPTGIVGVLQDAARRLRLPSASLWGQVPHYLSATPNPQVMLALLEHLNQLLDLDLALGAQELEARRFAVQVDAALTRDPDAASYVRRLEEQEGEDDAPDDDAPSSLPSGDVVVRELEDFLRRRRIQGEEPG
ncbi:MAG: PAC2 family protein [Chloroflexi bacterium]|nr:PAC2 family protein [Chloroflexota bacterium]